MIKNGQRLSIQINYKAPAPKPQPNRASTRDRFMPALSLVPGMESALALLSDYKQEDEIDDQELDRMIERLEKTVMYLETCNDLLRDALAIKQI